MVLTTIAAEGTGLRHRRECIIADTVSEWIEGINQLCLDEYLRKELSETAYQHIAENFSYQKGREDMRKVLESVDIYNSNP